MDPQDHGIYHTSGDRPQNEPQSAFRTTSTTPNITTDDRRPDISHDGNAPERTSVGSILEAERTGHISASVIGTCTTDVTSMSTSLTGLEQTHPEERITNPHLQFSETHNNLIGLCTSKAVIDELTKLPDPRLMGSVPDYFTNNVLSAEKLPAYLKGLDITTDSSHLTKEQINQLVHYCCVLPSGRDSLFTPSNTPGRVDDFKVLVDIADDSPWQARLIPCSPSDKDEIGKLLDTYLAQDVIEPCHGPYSCSVLLVRKSNGRHKIACCLNTLNA